MKQFVEEGINKIAELASADVEAELDKVKAVITAASEYTAIDGDNENSAVKFIIKTNQRDKKHFKKYLKDSWLKLQPARQQAL